VNKVTKSKEDSLDSLAIASTSVSREFIGAGVADLDTFRTLEKQQHFLEERENDVPNGFTE
jgi:hypothetical protein